MPERSDHTESKVRQWATRINGDPITNRDVIELVLAVDDDGNDRHNETMALMAEMQARLVLIEEWRATCPGGSIAEYVEGEHHARHADHMTADHPPRRGTDPESADFTEQRRGLTVSLSADEEMGDMRRAWRVVRWGVAAFVLPIIATGGYRLGQIIFG